MRGYKGTNLQMKCRGFQYEIGKTYTHEGEVGLCSSGFHFCKNLKSCFAYYDESESRFFEVEVTGDVVEFSENEDKGVTNSIRLVREITSAEVNRSIYSDGYGNGYNGSGYHGSTNYGCLNGNGYGDGDGWLTSYDSEDDGNDYYGDGWYGFEGNGCGDGDGNCDGCWYGYCDNIQKILNLI